MKMKKNNFFKISLFIPIIVSLCATARPWLSCISSTDSYCLNKTISDYELFIGLYPIMFGGIPYLIFLAVSLVWLTRKSPLPVMTFLIGAPLVYTGLFIILISGYYLLVANINEALTYSLLLGVYALAYGYLYAIVTGIIWFLVKRVGISSNKSLKNGTPKSGAP